MSRTNTDNLPVSGNILSIDWGEKRLGLARANLFSRLPQPLDAIENDKDTFQKLQDIMGKNEIKLVVIGLPRSLEGDYTKQTETIKDFADKLGRHIVSPIEFADETLSSVQARQHQKDIRSGSDLDSLAACYILEEFLRSEEGQ